MNNARNTIIYLLASLKVADKASELLPDDVLHTAAFRSMRHHVAEAIEAAQQIGKQIEAADGAAGEPPTRLHDPHETKPP